MNKKELLKTNRFVSMNNLILLIIFFFWIIRLFVFKDVYRPWFWSYGIDLIIGIIIMIYALVMIFINFVRMSKLNSELKK